MSHTYMLTYLPHSTCHMHTCIHAYINVFVPVPWHRSRTCHIHTYIHATYMHTYMHTYMYSYLSHGIRVGHVTYIHTYMHTYMQTYMYSYLSHGIRVGHVIILVILVICMSLRRISHRPVYINMYVYVCTDVHGCASDESVTELCMYVCMHMYTYVPLVNLARIHVRTYVCTCMFMYIQWIPHRHVWSIMCMLMHACTFSFSHLHVYQNICMHVQIHVCTDESAVRTLMMHTYVHTCVRVNLEQIFALFAGAYLESMCIYVCITYLEGHL
jgi:hypothetical protein